MYLSVLKPALFKRVYAKKLHLDHCGFSDREWILKIIEAVIYYCYIYSCINQ